MGGSEKEKRKLGDSNNTGGIFIIAIIITAIKTTIITSIATWKIMS